MQFRCHRVLWLGSPLRHLRFQTRLRSRHREPPRCQSPTPSRLPHCRRRQGPNSHPRSALITRPRRRRGHSTVRLRDTARGTARTLLTTSSCGNTRTGNGGIEPATVAPESMAEGPPESLGILGTRGTLGSPEVPGNRGIEAAEEEAKALVNKRAKLEGAGIHTQGLLRLPREH